MAWRTVCSNATIRMGLRMKQRMTGLNKWFIQQRLVPFVRLSLPARVNEWHKLARIVRCIAPDLNELNEGKRLWTVRYTPLHHTAQWDGKRPAAQIVVCINTRRRICMEAVWGFPRAFQQHFYQVRVAFWNVDPTPAVRGAGVVITMPTCAE